MRTSAQRAAERAEAEIELLKAQARTERLKGDVELLRKQRLALDCLETMERLSTAFDVPSFAKDNELPIVTQ